MHAVIDSGRHSHTHKYRAMLTLSEKCGPCHSKGLLGINIFVLLNCAGHLYWVLHLRPSDVGYNYHGDNRQTAGFGGVPTDI